MSKFTSNLVNDLAVHPKAFLAHGATELIIHKVGAKIVTGKLFRKSRESGEWKIIQLEQSGHRRNPELDQIKFELVDYDRQTKQLGPMRKGDYKVQVRHIGEDPHSADDGITSDSEGYTDEFEIV